MWAAASPWRFEAHPEVWLLVASVVVLGFFVTRVIQPKMIALGEAPVSRRQKTFFVAGVLLKIGLWQFDFFVSRRDAVAGNSKPASPTRTGVIRPSRRRP